MSKFQCPFPANLNPLSPNGFQLIIDKLPGVTFFCQQAPIPGISLPTADQETPFVMVPVPGETLIFEPMNVNFLVDEKMDNWKAVFNWMNGLGFPESNDQYIEYLNTNQNNSMSELQNFYSDAKLIVYGNNLTPIQTLNFIDIHPESLGELSFTNVSQDVEYLTANVSFRYSHFNFN